MIMVCLLGLKNGDNGLARKREPEELMFENLAVENTTTTLTGEVNRNHPKGNSVVMPLMIDTWQEIPNMVPG